MKTVLTVLAFCILYSTRVQSQGDTVIRGVPIHFDYSHNIFPESWRVTPVSGTGGSLERGERQRSKLILSRSLVKYPVHILQRNLRSVFVLRFMKFYNVGYGGTNSDMDIFITNDGNVLGYSDKYIEQTFHHEFSSILFRNHPALFDEPAWKNCNPPGFDYTDPENGVGAIRNNRSSQEIDTALCRLGFLTQYAMSGLENDINTIAQNLFKPADQFWETVDLYPSLTAKTRLLILFYQQLDPVFTETYFRNQ
jgi:hypothetical protein